MGAVHSSLRKFFENSYTPLEASDYQTLEVKLIGYTRIQGNVERVVVGDERACRCPPGIDWRIGVSHLDVSVELKNLTHGVEHARALQENILNAGIDHKVDVALAITHLRIGERVVSLAVLHLHHGGEGADSWKAPLFPGRGWRFLPICVRNT